MYNETGISHPKRILEAIEKPYDMKTDQGMHKPKYVYA